MWWVFCSGDSSSKKGFVFYVPKAWFPIVVEESPNCCATREFGKMYYITLIKMALEMNTKLCREEFMNEVQKFPSYEKSNEEFNDKCKKQNIWKTAGDLCNWSAK